MACLIKTYTPLSTSPQVESELPALGVGGPPVRDTRSQTSERKTEEEEAEVTKLLSLLPCYFPRELCEIVYDYYEETSVRKNILSAFLRPAR